ncbi:AAA family ATPase [Treponema succinifaciens]|uniref:AAA family ATPase n=1 Tax=Treponema succinifaciens TaxID=167 RepID=UPI003F7DFB2E
MSYPKPKIANSEIDLKLGIKSSLPNATQAIVLSYLIWKCGDKKSQISYSKQIGDGLSLKDELSATISDLLQRNVDNFDKAVFDSHILNNPLLKAQIEALIVGFELVWKLARFQFVDGSSFSAERTGGKRFEKIISYTSNIDILDLLVKSNEKDFLKFFYEILIQSSISNATIFDSFRKLLTVFSETAIYKIKIDNGDLIFDNSGIYKSLLEKPVVNLSGIEENKGSSRILKSSISEGLNYFITTGNGGYVKDESHSDDFSSYSERVENFLALTQIKVSFEDKNEIETKIENETNISPTATPFTSPEQIIFYGVPGSGKSHEIKHKLEEEYKIPEEKQDLFVERTVFHPEYTNADFIGQIMPKLVQGKTDFVFKPGPFTSILKKALCDSQNRYILIIEEINRGNAAAIFGELFQLLDRIDAASKTTSHDGSLNTYSKGWSEYFVMNSEINNYIRNSDDTFDSKALDINGIHFSANTGIRLPPNLSILATMNTSDQNVFTLDNAFQRRWDMKLIENVFRDTEEETNQRNAFVDSAKQITWEKFQTAINIKIGKMSEDAGLSSMEDKRLGCWFVKAEKTTEKDKNGKDIYIIRNELFAEKVLKYLWDDAFKFCREKVFNGYTNLESLTCDFKGEKEFAVFKNLFSETEN